MDSHLALGLIAILAVVLTGILVFLLKKMERDDK